MLPFILHIYLESPYSIHCLKMHHCHQLPETIPDPLPFPSEQTIQPNTTISSGRPSLASLWSTICTILYEFDSIYHENVSPSPSSHPFAKTSRLALY
ncbi:hypothetical protein G6F37_012122 [Rhizopus arrhizus]|nr:hypothetical protein G6F38_011343 [Rhizopus arrhizus]KAG1145575.1 hypothetical protein G6F37_012122 [Rhizopus arrhizus]